MKPSETEAWRWLRQAEADLEVVRTLRTAGHYAAACFHNFKGSRVVLGHSVRELARQCAAYDPVFATLQSDGALLDQFYIPTRYPNGLPSPSVPSEAYTNVQADMAFQAAERVVRASRRFLESSERTR